MTFADLTTGDKVVFSHQFEENMIFVSFEETNAFGKNALLVNENQEIVHISVKTEIDNERWFTKAAFEKLNN